MALGRGGMRRKQGVGSRQSTLLQRQRRSRCAGMRSTNHNKGNAMIEFFFDCSSPWTYLAFHNIQPLAKEFGAEISWRPILVGGIFNTINPTVYASREKPVEAKARYTKKDMADWARS